MVRLIRVLSIASLLLILVASGCGAEPTPSPAATLAPAATAVSTDTPTPTGQPTWTETPAPTVTPMPTAPPPVELGDEERNEVGGFAYRPIPGWTLEGVGGNTYMTAPGGDRLTGPAVLLSSELVAGLETLDDAWQSLLANLEEGIEVSEPRDITVDGVPGRIADLTGEVDGVAVIMRVALAKPGPAQNFVIAGFSPADGWAGQTEPLFEAVLASIRLFEPVTATEAPDTPTATPSPESTEEPGEPEELVSGWTIYSNANYVKDLAVHDGRLWAATAGGVAAWDPNSDEVTKYTTVDGLAHSVVNAVISCPVPEPRVVAGTRAGISILDPETGAWETLLPEGDDWIANKEVAALACAPGSKTLLVGYAAWGLYVWNSETGEWQYYTQRDDGLGNNMVRALAVVGDLDEIWAASMRQVSRITDEGITVYSAENTELLGGATVFEIVAGAEGSVWLGQFSGKELLRFRDGSWTAYSRDTVEGYPTLGGAQAMDLAADGTLWIASHAGEVCQFDPETETCRASYAREPGMVGFAVYSLAVAPQGEVYIGSQWGNGISAFDGSSWRSLFLESEQLVQNEIQGLGLDQQGMLWIGTQMGGTQRLDPARPSAAWESFGRQVPSLSVITFHADPSGGMWVGHGLGASYYDGTHWTHYGEEEGILPNVRAIAVDSQGRAWFGAYGGLSIWDGEAFTTLGEGTGLPGKDVRALLANGDVVWVATWDGGLLRFENDEFVVFDQDSGLPDGGVDALALDQDGSLLVGLSQALVRVGKDGQISEVLGRHQGLSGLVTSIAVDPDGGLWLASLGDGVYFFDGNEWRRFTMADGLPTNQFSEGSIVIDNLGTVWFGGLDGGLARYVP